MWKLWYQKENNIDYWIFYKEFQFVLFEVCRLKMYALLSNDPVYLWKWKNQEPAFCRVETFCSALPSDTQIKMQSWQAIFYHIICFSFMGEKTILWILVFGLLNSLLTRWFRYFWPKFSRMFRIYWILIAKRNKTRLVWRLEKLQWNCRNWNYALYTFSTDKILRNLDI